jgi:Cu+-exporting ATPase
VRHGPGRTHLDHGRHGRGARLGILVKSGAALQTAGAVDTVVFDKTGTLTHGKPELTDIVPLDGSAPEALLALAAGAEANSEHPLARAVTAAAKAKSLETATPETFEAVPGRGVAATLDGRRVLIGTPEYLAEQGAPLDATAMSSVAGLGGAGKPVVAMAVDARPAALLAIAATPRPKPRPWWRP